MWLVQLSVKYDGYLDSFVLNNEFIKNVYLNIFFFFSK